MFLKNMKWALLWAVLIFILCALPGKDVPFDDFWDEFNLDKLIHAGMFFIQAVLLINGLRSQTKFIALSQYARQLVFIVCVVYGGSLELLQHYYIEGRTGSWFDFAANTVGTLVGILLFKRASFFVKNYRK